ncbi:hypothetical protein [Arthrobacter sp. zg-Y1110]|uniref:hypothetical protein n=1 Tax=Arthrobacter sp. zg-Y1110 TaxID=2886932 RepID=UPI001D13A058|nr:hypothetical protein [Arthrobacter sp. zg-Y1110]MCC3292600.1 hypothetical protein [Arthrobacter sp. zg-Y1110]UWX86969.1 hypothetical protein N2K99_16585 [Arthrobacter sp. zg-Y1110]
MRIQMKSGSVHLDPSERREFSIVKGGIGRNQHGGADNPVGTYDLGYYLLLCTESDANGSVLIQKARPDLLQICIHIIERELLVDNPHLKTADILAEAYKIRVAATRDSA